MRQCSHCWRRLPLSEYYLRTDGRQAGNYSSRCRECVREKARAQEVKFPERGMVAAAKHRSKIAGHDYDLDEYREELRARVRGVCEVTGMPFKAYGERDWNSPSIDRILPHLGYVYSNVRIILWCMNSAFGYWGEEKFEEVARAWLAKKDESK